MKQLPLETLIAWMMPPTDWCRLALFVAVFAVPFCLWPWANPGFFERYKHRYFVETGSYDGGGIALAVDAGFQEIHSIELAERYYKECMDRFAKHPNIHLWLGDSGKMLTQVIEKIDEPITFWLDAHWSDGATARGDSNTPILKELEAIQRHPVKTHTILIDDVRQFGKWEHDFIPLQAILQKLYEINPNYVITYEDGFRPKDILVAQVPKD